MSNKKVEEAPEKGPKRKPDPPAMEEWDEISEGVNEPRTVIRTPGKHRYELKINEINGDKWEEIQINARYSHYDPTTGIVDEMASKKTLGYNLRLAVFVTVAGKPYEAEMDREMPMWLREDLDQFLLAYGKGNL